MTSPLGSEFYSPNNNPVFVWSPETPEAGGPPPGSLLVYPKTTAALTVERVLGAEQRRLIEVQQRADRQHVAADPAIDQQRDTLARLGDSLRGRPQPVTTFVGSRGEFPRFKFPEVNPYKRDQFEPVVITGNALGLVLDGMARIIAEGSVDERPPVNDLWQRIKRQADEQRRDHIRTVATESQRVVRDLDLEDE